MTSTDDKGRPAPASRLPPGSEAFFRKDGDYWSIAYDDTVLRLRDVKGLRYIAYLVLNPGVGFAARELMSVIETTSGHAIPVSASIRQASGADEQARLAVTKRIKAVIKRIEAQHESLAYHLSVSVKTGAYCMYRPDPARPVVWRS